MTCSGTAFAFHCQVVCRFKYDNSSWAISHVCLYQKELTFLITRDKITFSHHGKLKPRRFVVLLKSGASILKMEAAFLPKRWYIPSNPHGVTNKKTNIGVFTTVRTSKSHMMYCTNSFKYILLSIRHAYVYMLLCIDYYNHCHGNAVNGSSAL
jgi:hypothetical protein